MKISRFILPVILFSASLLPLVSAQTAAQGKVQGKEAVVSANHPREAQFRQRVYVPVEPIDQLAKRMKMSTYDRFENPTGIYFEEGDTVQVTMDGKPDTPVKLNVVDFSNPQKLSVSYDLEPGKNELKMTSPGLGYIQYESENYKKSPKIKVAIKGGKVNGVFTRKDDDKEWVNLLANAKAPFIDLYGERIHLVLPVDGLKKCCEKQGKELLALYDRIVEIEQRIIGFDYKGERPRNHMFGRTVTNGYMYADGIGAGFGTDTLAHIANMESLMNPAHITFGFWGITHELGHVNQTRPGFRWIGTTEVTNNLMAMACCFEINKDILRLERERHHDGVRALPGGYYNRYTKSGLIDGEQWQIQASADDTGHPNVGGGDVFVKLIPLWQLYLYCTESGMANKNFLPEFHVWLRAHGIDNQGAGQHQLTFMKKACELNKQDLTGFFEAVGMLKPIDIEFTDYGKAQLTITEKECLDLKKFALQYPKPKTSLIQYINASNIDIYKKQLPLSGPAKPGTGIEIKKNGACMVSHDVWKNAVAFETYTDGKLTGITLAGVGAPQFGAPVTLVHLPEAATEIKAVGWNGKRLTVYNK